MTMKTLSLTVIPGDGIGPEVTTSALRVLDAVRAPFEYRYAAAGETAMNTHGKPLPDETIASIRETGLAIKGPLATPSASGYSSANVALRKEFDLYANVRPARTLFPTRFDGVDLVLFRENVEGLYSGEEHYEADGEDLRGIAVNVSRNSRKGMRRFAEYCYRRAVEDGRTRMAVVHKSNILKVLSGVFMEEAVAVGKAYADRIETRTVIVDDFNRWLVMNPEQIDAAMTTNLFGDILSDGAAGTVGGLGLVPSANIGDRYFIAEAVHGTAPDKVGQNLANPTALILSAAMLLDHVGETAKGNVVRTAVKEVLLAGDRTKELPGGTLGTVEYTDAVIRRMAQIGG
jgi:isocitrate dehydrogenase (NAD+)